MDLVPLPTAGRTFRTDRKVRLGDVSPGGRLRLDALARYLQDVSGDDSDDAQVDEPGHNWVVRRTTMVVEAAPVLGETVELVTWCSGTGSRWAERRVSVQGDGSSVEAATLWVYVDIASGRPVRLPPAFDQTFRLSTGGRTVSARLRFGPPDAVAVDRPWPIRFSDFDVLGHVNNASYWEAVEEVLAPRKDLRPPFRVELEYGAGINRDAQVEILTRDEADGAMAFWLTADGVVAAAGYVSR